MHASNQLAALEQNIAELQAQIISISDKHEKSKELSKQGSSAQLIPIVSGIDATLNSADTSAIEKSVISIIDDHIERRLSEHEFAMRHHVETYVELMRKEILQRVDCQAQVLQITGSKGHVADLEVGPNR